MSAPIPNGWHRSRPGRWILYRDGIAIAHVRRSDRGVYHWSAINGPGSITEGPRYNITATGAMESAAEYLYRSRRR